MTRLLIANPDVRIVENREAVWAAAGLDNEGYRRLQDSVGSEPELEADLCRQHGDASIIKVERADGRAHSITAWKGMTSCHEVFYRVRPDGEIIISDHFRCILSLIPIAERTPSPAALCDHFLFRTVPADNTFCESVKRLGRGEMLVITPAAATAKKMLFDRIENLVRPGSLKDYLDRIDAALENALSPFRTDTGVAVLFSGGIDSTLLQTYLTGSAPPVCYVLPHYAHGFEADYASRAARLLGLELETHGVETADYLERLEGAITAAGMPPPHLQLAFYQTLFGLGHQRFIIGEQADAVFGIGMRKARFASYFISPLGQMALRQANPIAIGSAAKWLRLLRETASRLKEAPDSIDGHGGQFGIYTDWSLVEAVFGQDFVRDRLEARMAIMRDRLTVAAPAPEPFLRHLEAAQMVDFLCEDIMMCFRHLAHAFGKTVFSPFMTRDVFESALTIPVRDRYVRGFEGKYLPKRLLIRRLPGYPVGQRKGYTHVPFVDIYRPGPLSEVWRRYDVPDLFQGEHRDRLVDHPTQMTWNAITLAIWQEKVQRDAQLQPVAGTKSLSWEDALG